MSSSLFSSFAFVGAPPLSSSRALLSSRSYFYTRCSGHTDVRVTLRRVRAPTMLADDTGPKGFAKKPEKPKPSPGNQRRQAASDRYDAMAAAGMPEYTVWMRLKQGGTSEKDEQMPWLPVGCISVPRSSQVADALFDVEEDLMQGATRLYPNLKNEPRENIEFGYQLREFDDEEIKVAIRSPTSGWQATVTNFFRRIQNPINPPS